MKILKFIHGSADDIRQGIKTTTWRINDTQDISVNDQVELIDEVDKNDPKSWKVIGLATVEAVIEKRLRDISEDDLLGHRTFSSQEEMLRAYRRFAGSEVQLESPVKIIHFKLTTVSASNNYDVNISSILTDVKLYADGGSRGNPGPSAAGFVVVNADGQIVVKKGLYLGITTNNQAEYQALKSGLEEVLRMGAKSVHVYMDSMLVVNQMINKFKVKNRDLWPVHNQTKDLAARFEKISFTQIPRELNKLADHEVNMALDSAALHFDHDSV